MTSLAPTVRLDPLNDLGVRWSSVVRAAGPLVLPGSDPWLLHPVCLRSGALPASLPSGPAIYAAIGGGVWQYAGKTIQPVGSRLHGHAHDQHATRHAMKAAMWHYVAALVLVPDTESGELCRLERAAKDFLRPRGGSRWSRG